MPETFIWRSARVCVCVCILWKYIVTGIDFCWLCKMISAWLQRQQCACLQPSLISCDSLNIRELIIMASAGASTYSRDIWSKCKSAGDLKHLVICRESASFAFHKLNKIPSRNCGVGQIGTTATVFVSVRGYKVQDSQRWRTVGVWCFSSYE